MKTPSHQIRQRFVGAFLTLTLSLAALAPRVAHAQIPTANPPGQISYQGFLTDANGVPLATNAPKNYDVFFHIYNSPNSSTPVWGELQTVTIDKGYFSVLLGQGTSAGDGSPYASNLTGIFTGSDASDRYIGIALRGFSEVQPRLRLLASPYALLSANSIAVVGSGGSRVINTGGSTGTNVAINQAPGPDSLDINGGVGITGHNTLEFGQGITPKEANAGKVGYEAFSTFALDLVGAGTTGTSRRIKLWGEGGTSTTGALGIGTDNPATMLHILAAGSPEISLQSSDSSSKRWTLQSTSGLGGLPGSFQIIDRSLGVNRFLIDSAGHIGINNQSPTDALDVGGTVGASSLTLGGGSLNEGVFSMAGVGHLNDNRMYIRGGTDHNHFLGYVNQNVDAYFFVNRTIDGPFLTGCSGGALGVTCSPYAYTGYPLICFWWDNIGNCNVSQKMYSQGGFVTSSDRNVKTNFESIDEQQVLAKVATLPITRWSFTNSPAERHIGPVAQDFYASFGSGDDDKHISLTDEMGVALAAIKGLHEVVQEKDTELQTLKQQVQALQAAVNKLAGARPLNGQ
ncbi:MAG TPA: tail fiber domain-containing protein [Verrucomicrobiae bacterium]|jgi:hypothetical protein|nr:tail fiber domain-containing protein [Verrucomicrobiae bacterium]